MSSNDQTITDSPPRTTPAMQRVQRIPETWPVLHLEAEIPAFDGGITIEGLVERPQRLDHGDLTALEAEERNVAVHCVWGWSRSDARWTGVPLARVLDLAGAGGSHVAVHAASEAYSSCLPLDDAAAGMLVWARDGAPLAAEAGGPLRYLPPSSYWAYKSVKWAARVEVLDRFQPGFWEQRVADPLGRIPTDVVLP